jgi:hypothetical protein
MPHVKSCAWPRAQKPLSRPSAGWYRVSSAWRHTKGIEHFSLDGTEYEAFKTSSGWSTLCDT